VHDGGEYDDVSCSVKDSSPTPVELFDWGSTQNMTLTVGSPKLTVNVTGSGDVSVEGTGIPASYPNTTDQAWDDDVTLLAIPDAGWGFVNWSEDLSGSVNPDDITMDTLTKNVTANFAELPCDLDVDTNDLSMTARFSVTGYEDSDTVTISNDGGGTLCWQLSTPLTWSVGDTWVYMNDYEDFPPGSYFGQPYYNGALPCTENNTQLNLTVVGEDADYYYAVADWPLADPQRSAKPGIFIPCCLQEASVVVDKCTLDYVQQLANLTLYLPTPTPGQALVSWTYDSCHGWPYYPGKTWNYNMTITDALGTTVTPAQAAVTGYNTTMSAWEITHGSPNLGGTIFMQQFWSDTVRNFVYQWDGGTFVAPPVDERTLMSFSITGGSPPAACAAPSWLSFDKTSGSLGIGGNELLTVTANTSGLAVGTHNGSFCISGCCASVDVEVINVSLLVTPATTLEDVVRDLPADRLLPDAEYPGMTFDVYVNFTAPVADFNSIGVTDFAPAGWLVQTNDDWCDPKASYNKSNYNKAEYAWAGPYDPPKNFSAMYKVTIPATATAGSNFWPNCTSNPCPPCEGSPINLFPAWVEYWFGAEGPYETVICEEREKVVTVPGCVVGETRDVNANLLDTVTVVLYEEPLDANPEESDSSSMVPISTIPAPEHASVEGGTFSEDPTTWYENCADDTGYYWQYASKYCFYSINTSNMASPRNYSHPDYIDWSTPEKLAAGYRMDFEADYGLVCKAASMSYAMESVNHWLFVPIDGGGTPHPEWQIHSWKADESIHSWQFPCGCNC